jgi:hypothetical protein
LVRCRPGWAYGYADGHAYHDTYGHANCDADGHANHDTYGHANCDADGHANHDTYGHAAYDTHGHAYRDTDRDCRRLPRPQPGSSNS